MKRGIQCILWLTSLWILGCTLEEPFEGVYCPEDFSTQLSYINFYGVTCSAADCQSADHCCDIVETTLSKTIYESFKYSRCPANSNFSRCSNDGADYFCSSGCMFGYEMCKGSCVDFEAGHISSCVGADLVCETGWIDCDGKISNGCELSTSTNIQSCEDPETPICMEGWADCDGKMGNGCEVNLFADSQNCGACDNVCTENPICSRGVCSEACERGTANCGGQCLNLPVLNIQSCVPDSNELTCMRNYMDCDGELANGCEVNVLMSNENCGECGNSCGTGQVCLDGHCEADICAERTETPNSCIVDGTNVCKNIHSDDANHCGACNYKCAEHPIPNAISETCDGGNCQYICATGYVNVGSGNTAQTINCIDPNTDNTYCGAESYANPGESCTDGKVCVEKSCVTNSCTDASAPNLCVVNGLNSCRNINANDADHCGACNYKCSDHGVQNATSDTCFEGDCQYTCGTGYVNVGSGNTSQSIKCIDPKSDNSYCGAKSSEEQGKSCTGGRVCVDSQCVTNSCSEDPSKPNLCVVNGNNTCQNINSTDANHCGACNYKCADHAIPNATSDKCINGACQYTCASGYVNVGTGITANTILCIDPKTNNTYCNATGNASGAANASQKGTSCTGGTVCVDSSCQTNSCTDPSKPNLCVVNGMNTCQNINSTDANHCGACNYKCSDHAIPNATSDKCINGNCQYICASGYVNVGTGITANTILCIDPKTNNTYCNATGNASGAANASQKGTSCTGGTVCVDSSCQTNSCTDSSKPNLCVVNGQNTCQNINSTDANHCGACNYKCSDHAIPNAASSACKNGECQYTCASGYVNVGKGITADTILCIDPKSNSTYCNATGNASGAASSSQKGTACTGGTVCVNGSCETNSCTDSSKPNLCVVNGQNTCQNVNSTDANHCGACNYRCSEHAIPNAKSSACKNGECQYTCASGYVNVGTGITAQTILCIDPKSNSTYCNATGNATGAASSSQKGTACTGGTVCVNGSCETNSCTDSSKPNLCVVNGQNTCQNINSTDANHCGACNYKCSDHAIPNAKSSACKNGECQYTCASGYVNVGTGITAQTILCIDPKSNSTYCNATGNATGAASSSQKGTACTGGTVCVNGSCETNSCTDSSKPNLCVVNGQNTCQNVNSTDANHCGACNYKCSDHAIPNATSNACISGQCKYTCTNGYVNVGTGIRSNQIKCIDPSTDIAFCGASGNASGAASDAQRGTACNSLTQICAAGQCQQRPELVLLVDFSSSSTSCWQPRGVCSDVDIVNQYCTTPPYNVFSFEKKGMVSSKNNDYEISVDSNKMFFQLGTGYYDPQLQGHIIDMMNQLPSYSCPKDYHIYHEGGEINFGDGYGCDKQRIICVYSQKADKFFKVVVFWYHEAKFMYWMPDILEEQ